MNCSIVAPERTETRVRVITVSSFPVAVSVCTLAMRPSIARGPASLISAPFRAVIKAAMLLRSDLAKGSDAKVWSAPALPGNVTEAGGQPIADRRRTALRQALIIAVGALRIGVAVNDDRTVRFLADQKPDLV